MLKKILLITWWLGYIGSHAVVAFEEAGYKTVIVDNLDNSSLSVLENIWQILGYKPDFYKVDIRDLEEMEKIFKKYNFDWIIHFAGFKVPFESIKNPLGYIDNNIIWSIRLFEIMKKYSIKNIVFSSTAAVYDFSNISPINEWGLVLNTHNPYGTTKFIIERILLDLSKYEWFNVINLRYFNPVWAHKSGLIGENVEWVPCNIFPYIMKVLTWELDELKIFWSDYDTKDGTWVRDYIDINDLVEWHLKAYKKILENKKEDDKWLFETFNLWIGKWISVLELLKVCEEISGKKVPYKVIERRSWDLGEVYCSPEKAEKILWWKAKISIEESVKNGLRFYENTLKKD